MVLSRLAFGACRSYVPRFHIFNLEEGLEFHLSGFGPLSRLLRTTETDLTAKTSYRRHEDSRKDMCRPPMFLPSEGMRKQSPSVLVRFPSCDATPIEIRNRIRLLWLLAV